MPVTHSNGLGAGSSWLRLAVQPAVRRGGAVALEGGYLRREWGGVPAEVAFWERPWPVEQQLMHVRKPPLQRGGLGRGRRGEGVRVDAGQREMPEREPQVPAQLAFDLLDRVERLTRVRALVIAVLDDQAAGG